jgi:hypothetical protein
LPKIAKNETADKVALSKRTRIEKFKDLQFNSDVMDDESSFVQEIRVRTSPDEECFLTLFASELILNLKVVNS